MFLRVSVSVVLLRLVLNDWMLVFVYVLYCWFVFVWLWRFMLFCYLRFVKCVVDRFGCIWMRYLVVLIGMLYVIREFVMMVSCGICWFCLVVFVIVTRVWFMYEVSCDCWMDCLMCGWVSKGIVIFEFLVNWVYCYGGCCGGYKGLLGFSCGLIGFVGELLIFSVLFVVVVLIYRWLGRWFGVMVKGLCPFG